MSGPPQAILLTTMPFPARKDLKVHLVGSPTLEALVPAALELRKLHPRAKLIVAAPARVVRELERRYPPLIDLAVPDPTPELVQQTLD
ncbi:MAG TPA: hypothetical protein VK009_26420 [Chloroflexota bacterium]|nr:hypothetical protein [Chloroflexota bacterium]